MYSQLQAFIQEPKHIRQYPRSASFEEGPLYVVYGLDRQFSANPGFKTWGNFGKRAFFYVAERGGYDLELVHTIMDHDVPAYELYRLKKAK